MLYIFLVQFNNLFIVHRAFYYATSWFKQNEKLFSMQIRFERFQKIRYRNPFRKVVLKKSGDLLKKEGKKRKEINSDKCNTFILQTREDIQQPERAFFLIKLILLWWADLSKTLKNRTDPKLLNGSVHSLFSEVMLWFFFLFFFFGESSHC